MTANGAAIRDSLFPWSLGTETDTYP